MIQPSCMYGLPRAPRGHRHSYDPAVFVHTPKHFSGSAHSLMSDQANKNVNSIMSSARPATGNGAVPGAYLGIRCHRQGRGCRRTRPCTGTRSQFGSCRRRCGRCCGCCGTHSSPRPWGTTSCRRCCRPKKSFLAALSGLTQPLTPAPPAPRSGARCCPLNC